MSVAVNPYQSPETAAVPETPLAAQGALTENMLICLKGTSPWLRFMGILGFVSAAATALWGLISLFLIPVMREAWSYMPGIPGLVFGGSMALLFIAIGALIFIPSLFLYRCGEKIRSYLRAGMDQDLEQAFKNNKAYWKFVGILYIILLASAPLTLIVSIILVLAGVF